MLTRWKPGLRLRRESENRFAAAANEGQTTHIGAVDATHQGRNAMSDMITRRHVLAGSTVALVVPFGVRTTLAQTQTAGVTILFDAFGKPSNLKRGWGYSSLIEYG